MLSHYLSNLGHKFVASNRIVGGGLRLFATACECLRQVSNVFNNADPSAMGFSRLCFCPDRSDGFGLEVSVSPMDEAKISN